MTKVKENDTVKVHYTGKLDDGEIFDTSVNKDPIQFKVGAGQMIPGFENGVIGLELNESKTIKIPADEAYGQRRDELIQKVEKAQLPEEIKPEVGMNLVSQTPDGQQMMLTVTEVEESTITVDANHPLAGKDLTFDLTVTEIQ
jgi:FKBP-type peptidyl-prolyl cis-trans isomerase 2